MILLLVHATATLALVGLIWFVQVVHYPLFELASESRFERFALEHQRRTTWVVVPLMLTELASALLLLVRPPDGVSQELLWVGSGLLGAIWISTALLQVPLHRRLSGGRDRQVMRRLVATNWVRTLAWSGRGWVALALLVEALD